MSDWYKKNTKKDLAARIEDLKMRERIYVAIIERACREALDESLQGNDCSYSVGNIGGFDITFFAGMIESIEDTRQDYIMKEALA